MLEAIKYHVIISFLSLNHFSHYQHGTKQSPHNNQKFIVYKLTKQKQSSPVSIFNFFFTISFSTAALYCFNGWDTTYNNSTAILVATNNTLVSNLY